MFIAPVDYRVVPIPMLNSREKEELASFTYGKDFLLLHLFFSKLNSLPSKSEIVHQIKPIICKILSVFQTGVAPRPKSRAGPSKPESENCWQG